MDFASYFLNLTEGFGSQWFSAPLCPPFAAFSRTLVFIAINVSQADVQGVPGLKVFSSLVKR